MSTPEPLISTIRWGSIPSLASAARSSGFCTTTQPRPFPAARRSAMPSGGSRNLAAKLAAEKPEPRPIIESIDTGGADELRKASRRASPPNSTGFSATWWTMSGRSALYSRAISLMARTAPTSPSPRRRHAIGRRTKPSLRICSPCARTRVATPISKPASRAARATGSRCEQKYQSSVTKKRSFGRRTACDAVGGDTGCTTSGKATREGSRLEQDAALPALLRYRHLSNAFVPGSLAQSRRKLGLKGKPWRASW